MNRKPNGFTLIETIAVLLLVAILAMSAFVSLLPMTEALQQMRANAAAAQKARLAMARICREFTTITAVAESGPASIRYAFLLPAGADAYVTHQHTLSWAGGGASLMLQDNDGGRAEALSDDVADFQLTYAAGPPLVIHVRLQSQAGGNVFSNRVVPRNIHP